MSRRGPRRRTWWVGLGVVAALLATACGSPAADAPRAAPNVAAAPALLRARDVARVTPAQDAPVAAVVAGVSGFGYALGGLVVRPGDNLVLSPLSIAYAFAMARAGAGGQTAAEFDKAFGFPATGVHDAFNAISRSVATADVPPARSATPSRRPGEPAPPPVVCLGDALFPQAGFDIGPDFLATLARQYGAGVYPVDFTGPAATRTIDAWVRRQTADRITKLFDSLDPATRLVLANTVYLRASWALPFGPTTTAPGAFHRVDGSAVSVPLMHVTGPIRYADGPGWQMVELPYASGDLAMRIVLPAAGAPAYPLLSPPTMASMAAGLRVTRLDLTLPRWNFATSLDLKALLGRLGVTAAFDPNRADFSGIHPGLFVSQAIHRATITVDESGTEAAAVTGLAMELSLAAPATLSMVADHPFGFEIVQTTTGLPLFLGQVGDPSAG
jgi:serpin B